MPGIIKTPSTEKTAIRITHLIMTHNTPRVTDYRHLHLSIPIQKYVAFVGSRTTIRDHRNSPTWHINRSVDFKAQNCQTPSSTLRRSRVERQQSRPGADIPSCNAPPFATRTTVKCWLSSCRWDNLKPVIPVFLYKKAHWPHAKQPVRFV